MAGVLEARADGGQPGSGSRDASRRRLLTGGIALGWLLFVGGAAQLAWTGTAPVVAGVDATGTIRSAGLGKAVDSGSDDAAAPIAPNLNLDQALEVVLHTPDAMPAVIEEWRQSGQLPLERSVALADALYLHAQKLGPPDWRQRAGCFALVGQLLLACCESSPAELERAGDVTLFAMKIYLENGAGAEAGSAARLARRSYERILGDPGVSDREMIDAVKGKLARVNAATVDGTQERFSP